MEAEAIDGEAEAFEKKTLLHPWSQIMMTNISAASDEIGLRFNSEFLKWQ